METQEHERLYFDNLSGPEAYMEVNWNRYAREDEAVRLVVGREKAIIRQEDVETFALIFSKRPEKFMQNKSQKMGLKYVPVPIDQYRSWKKWQDKMKHKTGREMRGDITKHPTIA